LREIQWCLRQIHHPESEECRIQARRRIVFEEFFYMQLELAMRRAETHQELGIAFPIADLEAGKVLVMKEVSAEYDVLNKRTASVGNPQDLFFVMESQKRDGEPLWEQIKRMLPFEMTGAQYRVVQEVLNDMALPHPMNRLVQGGCRFGKDRGRGCLHAGGGSQWLSMRIDGADRNPCRAALQEPQEIFRAAWHPS
jgi:ATP-dependent DNA helicase RecG